MTIPNICDVLNQNQRLFRIQNPPTRFNPINPYDGSILNPKTNKPYTAFDFNMRRKTEILKYAPNKQSSQTNNLTKSQKWGQIVSGNYQQQSYTIITVKGKTYLNGKQVNLAAPSIQAKGCAINRSKPTLTTACGVPGPPIYLYEDDSVPLYNYISNTGSYAIKNEMTSPNWYIESYNDITSTTIVPSDSIFSSYYTTGYTNPSIVASLYIVSPIYSVSTFSMTIPVGFYFAGSNNISYLTPLILDISQVALTVLSNNTIIPLTAPYSVDISRVPNFDVNIQNSSVFSIGQYAGNITISNIVLPTSSGNIYDFQLSYMMDISNIDMSYKTKVQNTVCGVISNITGNLTPMNTTSSIRTSVPKIAPSTQYKVIQNPTNGFAFAEK